MEQITHFFLVNFVSPLLLLIFVIGTLCMIADVRPEPVITGLLSLCTSVIRGVFQLLAPKSRARIPKQK